MGIQNLGTPLTWKETKKHSEYVKRTGITQLIKLYSNHRERCGDPLYFGDEIEYTLVKFNSESKKVKLCLKAGEYLKTLHQQSQPQTEANWMHEFSSYMIEGTPRNPYGSSLSDLLKVEENMKQRRKQLVDLLDRSTGESVLSLTVFPRLGCPNFTEPEFLPQPNNSIMRSVFYPDEALGGHPRFGNIARSARGRRDCNSQINAPIFQDHNTPTPFLENLDLDQENIGRPLPDHIYMDCIGFGFGCSCLQVTLQAPDVMTARHLYDQMAALAPVFIALSAASPVYRGYLSDIDHRWFVLSEAIDDRTNEELGLAPLKYNRSVISKSRFDSISWYISPAGSRYNDIDLLFDDHLYNRLLDSNMDSQLAKHFAHLFIRDPMSLFKEGLVCDDDSNTEHFNSIQSTNYNTVRFEPPPTADSNIGWRVEVRPMDCQLTDFENAALTVFVVLLTKVILSCNLNMLIPISKLNENMKRAVKRDAVLNEWFYFCTDVRQKDRVFNGYNNAICQVTCEKLTIDEIVNGKSGEFSGLLPMIRDYIATRDDDTSTVSTVNQYLDFISQRASGDLATNARFMRDQIRGHPAYQQDSIVSDEIAFDLLKTCDRISRGKQD